MPQGVVLWPDEATSRSVLSIWDRLAERGLPSMATHTHQLHEPHVSLIVADSLHVREALEMVGQTPLRPLPLSIDAVSVVPGGHLLLTCIGNQELLDEHRRVHEAVGRYAINPWPHYAPGAWLPHITTAHALTDRELAAALPTVLEYLPIRGWLTRGWIEDGATGERWPPAGPER